MSSPLASSLQPPVWIGLLSGWLVSGLVVATTDTGSWGAFVSFLIGAAATAAYVYDRQQRLLSRSAAGDLPGPWDGNAWQGWLMLTGRVIACLVVVRILSAVAWSAEWTSILWRIHP